jgi:hypothetical protein
MGGAAGASIGLFTVAEERRALADRGAAHRRVVSAAYCFTFTVALITRGASDRGAGSSRTFPGSMEPLLRVQLANPAVSMQIAAFQRYPAFRE